MGNLPCKGAKASALGSAITAAAGKGKTVIRRVTGLQIILGGGGLSHRRKVDALLLASRVGIPDFCRMGRTTALLR